ncbi:MAG: MMPL family transporter [Pseudomonadota bacterium]
MLNLLESFMLAWTGLARRTGWFGVIAFLAAAVVAGWIAATGLKVNTDTSEMLDPTLDFQVRAKALRDAFPSIKEDIVVVIEAPTMDEADAFASQLATRLENSGDHFESVFSPTIDPFFRENGLLYLDTNELESNLSQLSKAASLIETLAKAPTAGTLFQTLADNDALADRSDLGQEELEAIYTQLADVAEASLKGEPTAFSWLGIIDEQDTTDTATNKPAIRLVYAKPALDYTRLQPAKPALRKLKSELDAIEGEFATGRVQTFITGDPALRADELSSVANGIGLSFAISFVAVGILLLIAYRSIFLSVMTLCSLIISITITAAVAVATVGQLNLVSVAFTVLLVGLGLDFAIHLLLHVQERRAASQEIKEALSGAVREVGPALALTAPTTAIGFFAFMPTKFDGIAQLGLIAGCGVIIAFFVAITFLPAAIGAMSPRRSTSSGGVVRAAFAGLERISKPVAALTILAGLASLVLLPQARFDADPMALRNQESPSVLGFQRLFEDPQTQPYRLSRLVDSEEEVNATRQQASGLPTVGSVRALTSFIPDEQDDKLDLIDIAAGTLVFALDAQPSVPQEGSEESAGPSFEDGANKLAARLNEAYPDGSVQSRLAGLLSQLPGKASAAKQLEQALFAYWPDFKQRLADQLNADYVGYETLPPTLTDRYRAANGQWRVDILPAQDPRSRKNLLAFVSEVESAFPDIAGGASQSLKAGQTIAEAMLQATGIALGVIAVFLFLLLRRPSDVILVLFPLLLAASLTTAAGVLFDIPFNYANVIVLPLLLGIGVDSGIHLVLRDKQVSEGATLYGTSTPRAVLFSALTTIASFGSLTLSAHRGTASMGELLTIAIFFTLVCTLIVLPAMLSLRKR